jgi:hypothetical protein
MVVVAIDPPQRVALAPKQRLVVLGLPGFLFRLHPKDRAGFDPSADQLKMRRGLRGPRRGLRSFRPALR